MLTDKEKGGNINFAAEIRRLVKAEDGEDRTAERQQRDIRKTKPEKII